MDTAKDAPKIILVGSPNVGKSVIFGQLTGRYVTVSNYPGTTVEVSRGRAKIGATSIEVIDTPGLYSIYPITEEEQVTLRIIEQEKDCVIVHVIDAKNLTRMLPLTFQLRETGRPVIVVLNMFDELLALGMNIGTGELSEELNLPVVATVAVTNQGIGQLIKHIDDQMKQITASPPLPHQGGGAKTLPPYSDRLMQSWHRMATEIASRTLVKKETAAKMPRIDRALVSPISGFLILAVIIYLGLYQFVGKLGAGALVNLLENGFQTYVTPWLLRISDQYVPWAMMRELFVGQYGMFTLGLRYAIAIILPIVGLFFLFFAVIEDSGYLPRLAYLLDSIFKRIGLSGKAVIPMVLGLGCDTMATMVVRTLATRRERLIATFLLSLTIPCSAQMGVILGLLSNKPGVLVAWAAIVTGIFLITGSLLSRILPGEKPVFVMEIPPMRLPKFKNVLVKTWTRMQWYFKEIIPLFLLASIIIWVGKVTGILDWLIRAIARPLEMMGLPASSAFAFIFGFFRRDYGAAGLYDLNRSGAFTDNQLLIAAVVLTLFMPCIAQLLITIKERGWRLATGISVFILFFAFLVGVLLNNFFILTKLSF